MRATKHYTKIALCYISDGLISDPRYLVLDRHNRVYSADIDEVWGERIHRLQQGCSDMDNTLKYKIQYKQSKSTFFNSRKLNLSVCKVQKAGSTFWIIVFLTLDQGRPAEEVFSIPRHKLHTIMDDMADPLPLSDGLIQLPSVVVSRDPYSRLYSAFIDRYFFLEYASAAKRLAESLGKGFFLTEAGKCGYNVTFQEFLDNVTTDSLQGKFIDHHWCPVYTLCRVCDVDYQYVIRQETLTRDTEEILQRLKIDEKTKTTLTRMLHGSAMNKKTMDGVIHTMWASLGNKVTEGCCDNTLAYLMKMWEGFKIQGYIRTDIPFPVSEFESRHNTRVEQFSKVVLDTMTLYPLSSAERETRRRQFLVNAYKGISERTVKKIQEMYLMDFRIFGYDANPPV